MLGCEGHRNDDETREIDAIAKVFGMPWSVGQTLALASACTYLGTYIPIYVHIFLITLVVRCFIV